MRCCYSADARQWNFANILRCGLLVLNVSLALGQSQVFSSGSTGADGALNFVTPGSYFFDPTTIPNHHAGDTVFNFTTINVAQGVTIRFDSRNLPGPVYLLATGAVTIAGTLDLSGSPGHQPSGNLSDRAYSTPGAGGFAGGPGGGSTRTAEAGRGPGGGAAPAGAGTFTGSQYLIPLLGGSGGAGNFASCPFGAGGGAGGGAILIATSTSLSVTGIINASGGTGVADCSSGGSGSGSGGAIRLMGQSITHTGNITVLGPASNPGYIRLEAYSVTAGGLIQGPRTISTPAQIALPATAPSNVTVVSVAGIPVNANPFTFPDATINSTATVPVVIQAQFVPVGSIPTLYIISESANDQVITAPPLAGTLASSSSTVNIAFPPNGSHGLIKVTWTQ